MPVDYPKQATGIVPTATTGQEEPSNPLLPEHERQRLTALRSYHILDTAEEKDFDELTQLASAICQTPIALISLVDQDRQWFKSHTGLATTQTSREYSFCAHAIASGKDRMIVQNAKADSRFSDNPLVTGELNITFYAGVPLVNEDGFALGSFCVADTEQRQLTDAQLKALTVLAKQVVDKLELRRKVMTLQDTHTRLQASYEELALAHRQLHENRHRFSQLLARAPIALATLKDRELVIETANQLMLQVWNKDASAIGQPLARALPELQGQPYLQLLDQVFVTGETFYGSEAKTSFVRDGSQVEGYFNFVYQPLYNDDGTVDGILIIASEITDQVQSRKALAEANHWLEMALDAGRFGSYELDLLTGRMTCTEQCKKNFGLPAAAPFDLPQLFNAILPEHRDHVEKKIQAAVMDQETYNAEYEVLWPDNSRHWIAATGRPVLTDEGKVLRMIGVTYEITERKTLEQQKDDFLSIASHELKTPITSLKGSLQMLDQLKNQPGSTHFPRLVGLANRSVEKISVLVDQLLNINRIDHDQLHLNKSIFTVASLLQNSCQQVQLGHQQELLLQGDVSLLVEADENRVEQVIVNLVNNALKYAPDSREIYLTAQPENRMVKISVKDNGPGIPEERQPHLFKRYYRADHSGTSYSGLGLGLYICAEIIRKHGGEIGVNSIPGQGSEFWFTLPMALQQPAAPTV